MSISNSMPSRRTLLTTSALAGTTPETPHPSVSANAGEAAPQGRDATTPFFYIILGFIMVSLIFGLFPQ